jgi:hypothetical protein
MEKQTHYDPFFFLHSFIVAFAPWSIMAYIAVGDRIRRFRKIKWEFASSLIILIVFVLVSISRYQLPHYLNVIFPFAAVLAAALVTLHPPTGKWLQAMTVMQMIISLLILIAAALLNAWFFPVSSGWVIAGIILLLSLVFYFVKSRNYDLRQRAICVSASSMLFFFFLMNTNFYPQLLKYQGGKDLAAASRPLITRDSVYVWDNTFSSSFHFHSGKFRLPFHDSILLKQDNAWLLFDEKEEAVVRDKYELEKPLLAAEDFEVTRLTLKFLDPSTRKDQTTRLVLGRIKRK